MNITEMRCSACDGTLKIDENNPNMAVCEYCHSKFVIEWNKGIAGGTPSLKTMSERINYQPVQRKEAKKTGWEPYGWKRGVALVVAFFVILGVWKGPGVYQRYQMDKAAAASMDAELSDGGEFAAGNNAAGQEASAQDEIPALEGILKDFAEAVFSKPVDQITAEELESIQWMEMASDIDFRKIGYSFENPFENPEAELTWVQFPRDDYQSGGEGSLRAFTGLKMLGAGTSLQPENVKGLPLLGIKGYFGSMEAVAALVEQPEILRTIEMSGQTVSLSGIDKFPELESLAIISSSGIEEEKLLINAQSLKKLTIDMYDSSMDFASLGMMTWLEELTIESQNLKDLGFVSKMDALKALRIEYGGFLSLEPLRDRTGLTELSLVSCDEVKDMSAISGLTGLKKLKLELPYGCEQPDLSGLVQLEELYLEGFNSTGFLRGMSALEKLTLDGCQAGDAGDFAGLTSLTSLSCTAFGYSDQDYGFITSLPALVNVDLHGTITYDDISGIFNMPTVKKMNISGMECEINFDRIQENTTLESLSMNKMKLYKNVSVTGGGGIYSVNWDDVVLTEHLDFLGKFKGLKELKIRENELTDISFVSSLEALQTIDFSDNYVTDLSPLSGCRALKQVSCTDNPVSNYDILGESVVIFK